MRVSGKSFGWLFIAWLGLASVVQAANRIDGIRVWPAPENTRVVFDLHRSPEFTYFSLNKPERLVVDFKGTKNIVDLSSLVKNDKRIKRIRKSKAKKTGDTRLVLDLAQPYQVELFPLTPAGQYGNRLVIDLYDKDRNAKVRNLPKNNKRDVIIGIDAGHGGEDPGSIGHKGTYEKNVTLDIAKKLAALVNNQKGMKAVMTRTGDYYVNLDSRTKIARKNQVDFLVSIHADAFRTPKPNGASVWVVSNKRVESEMARWLVNREKNSELLGGGGGVIKNTADDNLAITLADMNKEHSLEVSIRVASDVIKELRKITKMHKKTPQHASLAVLKASDIPSVLVETGFISNHKEERNLISSAHQKKLARGVFTGLKNYFNTYPPMGTYFASIGKKKHKIVSGESLSVVAHRYNITIKELKAANNLKSNVVKVGQLLTIPRAG